MISSRLRRRFELSICCEFVKQFPIAFQGQNESAAILKIKESMQEELKMFEKDGDQPDYFKQ